MNQSAGVQMLSALFASAVAAKIEQLTDEELSTYLERLGILLQALAAEQDRRKTELQDTKP